MRSHLKAAVLAASTLVCCGPAAAQVVQQTKKEPTSNGEPMPPGEKRHDLGGKIAFGPLQIERVSPYRKPIAPEARKPFTVSEVLAVAPAPRKKLGAAADGSDAMVLVWQTNPDRQTWRPIGAYVEELNKYESWLNDYGYTLRQGAFAGKTGRSRKTRQPSLKDAVLAKSLGLRFRLSGLPQEEGGIKPPDLYRKLFRPQIIYEPAPVQRSGRIEQPAMQTRNALGLSEKLGSTVIEAPTSIEPRAGAVAQDFQLSPALRNMQTRGAQSPAISVETKAMSAQCAAEPCTLKYGVEYVLTPYAQKILNNDLISVKYQCKVINLGSHVTDPAQCGLAGVEYEHKIYARDIYPYDPDFLKSWQDVCKWKDKLGTNGFAEFYQKTPGYNPENQTSGGDIEIVKGGKAEHMYDGLLTVNATDIRDCLPTVSENFLFGAHACLGYGSKNTYAPNNPLRIAENAGINVGVTLFGFELPLIDGDATIKWTQPVGAGATPGGAGAPEIAVVNPNTESTLQPEKDTEYFKGPEATVPLGPIPLTITSFLEATLSVGGAKDAFKVPPLSKPTPGEGELKMSVGAEASVWGGFDAALDAIVASAGVTGKLSFMNDMLGGSVGSTINPAANDLTVTKAYEFTQEYMKGSVSAFVEIDLLLYTKRWSVEIVRFDGFSPPPIPLDIKTYHGYAVIPETAKKTCE
jgi:hypothetical protein